MLDTTLQAPMSDELLTKCWGIVKDKSVLLRALLEWCVSLHRSGSAKIYVTCRLLDQRLLHGIDVTGAVLDFLDTESLEEAARKRALYHLVRELVRSNHFSIARYVQWLLARGGISDALDVASEAPAATRLLVELPVHCLSPSQQNVRSGALRRAGFHTDEEARDVESAKRHIKRSMGTHLDAADPILRQKRQPIAKLAKLIARSSHALRAGVSSWLRDQVLGDRHMATKESCAGADISHGILISVRSVLEAAEDFAMLSDVLLATAKSSSVDVLASCADTLNRHLLIFSAIGSAKPIFDVLNERLRAVVEVQGLGARPLLASMVSLAPRMPGLEALAAQLRRDLTRTDRNNPVDACSPVSDNMAARLQDADGDLHEETEKLLTSGTSLDRNTMDRLHQNVTQRFELCWRQDVEKQRAYAQLLTRLRVFDMPHFDRLMGKWLMDLRTQGNRPSILRIYPLLISVGCLDPATILVSASADSPTAVSGVAARSTAPGGTPPVRLTYRTRYMQEVLQLFMGPVQSCGLLVEESYRFAVLQDQVEREHSREILTLVRNALAEYSYAKGQNDTEGLPLEEQATREQLLALLRRMVLKDATGVARALAVKNLDPQVSMCIENLTTRLLMPTAGPETRISFEQILDLTNEFTLPFCQVKLVLRLVPTTADTSSPDASERQQSHLELFANAMDKAIEGKNITWTGMLSCFGPDTTHHVRARARARFLELLPSLRNPAPYGGSGDGTLEQALQTADNLMAVLEAIARGTGAMGRPPQPLPAMVDKLGEVWELLASDEAGARAHKPTVLRHWLPLLLAFFTLHLHTFDGSNKASNELRARALVGLAGLLQTLDLAPHGLAGPGLDLGALSVRVFDLGCVLADNLPEENRADCVRVIQAPLASDRRVRYLFSFMPAPH